MVFHLYAVLGINLSHEGHKFVRNIDWKDVNIFRNINNPNLADEGQLAIKLLNDSY